MVKDVPRCTTDFGVYFRLPYLLQLLFPGMFLTASVKAYVLFLYRFFVSDLPIKEY